MISITAAVTAIVTLLVAAVIFYLFDWLIGYVGRQFESAEPFVKVARIVLAILAVLVCIGILLSLVSGIPLFRP